MRLSIACSFGAIWSRGLQSRGSGSEGRAMSNLTSGRLYAKQPPPPMKESGRRSVTWYKSGLSNKALLLLEKLGVALDTDPGFLIVRESPKKRNK